MTPKQRIQSVFERVNDHPRRIDLLILYSACLSGKMAFLVEKSEELNYPIAPEHVATAAECAERFALAELETMS